MKPVEIIKAIAAPMMQANIDTDIIIPSREIKRISKKGLSSGLFAGRRYISMDSRIPDPGFILNQDYYKAAGILIAGANFGCGSSREHAVWALAEYGIQAVIAPSFSSIFYKNCINNGVLPINLDLASVNTLAGQTRSGIITIDLKAQTVTSFTADLYKFEIEPVNKHALLEGLDPIDQTLCQIKDIDAFEVHHQQKCGWAVLKV